MDQDTVKYWKTNMCSTRISVCVRIISESLLFENVIYICDNSLLNSIQCIPLIIENKQLFECVCDINNKSNEWFYEHQPLVILRDIAMYFKNINENNGQLQLKFDMFSMINEINNIELIANNRKCLYKYHLFGAEKNIFNMNELNMTPWKALNSVMIEINGSIELVSINDGSNVLLCELEFKNIRMFTKNESYYIYLKALHLFNKSIKAHELTELKKLEMTQSNYDTILKHIHSLLETHCVTQAKMKN